MTLVALFFLILHALSTTETFHSLIFIKPDQKMYNAITIKLWIKQLEINGSPYIYKVAVPVLKRLNDGMIGRRQD